MRPFPRLLLAGSVLVGVTLPGVWLVAAASDPAPAPALPELPSVAEQVDGLYDADGCLRTGTAPGDLDCSVRADALDEALSHGAATEPRHLEGFSGPYWLGQVDGQGPVVLTDSVSITADGPFRAIGLARNEGTEVVASIEVTAHLVDATGAELDVVTVSSPVHDVRPGEPVPFDLSSTVVASAVDHVEWRAAAGTAGDGSTRALSWSPFWERPAGGDPVDLYLYRDGTGPRPHLLFGSVAVVGGSGVDRPEVVVGHLTADGRLVALASGAVQGPDGSPLDRLDPGSAADAMVLAPTDPPPGGETVVWVQGS
jgi:hypothetical protein